MQHCYSNWLFRFWFKTNKHQSPVKAQCFYPSSMTSSICRLHQTCSCVSIIITTNTRRHCHWDISVLLWDTCWKDWCCPHACIFAFLRYWTKHFAIGFSVTYSHAHTQTQTHTQLYMDNSRGIMHECIAWPTRSNLGFSVLPIDTLICGARRSLGSIQQLYD